MAGQKQGVRWLLPRRCRCSQAAACQCRMLLGRTSPTLQCSGFAGRTPAAVRWPGSALSGGKVVITQNQQGKTRLEIATVIGQCAASAGRTVLWADFCRRQRPPLDPADFRGQLVTVVSRLPAWSTAGSTPYKFMLMNATGYKRWNVVQQVVMPPQPIDPWMLGPRPWGYGYGGWGWYNPGPAEVRNVVTE